MQDAYRTEMSEAEKSLWIQSLTDGSDNFSMFEIMAALNELVRNPPKYEVDGQMQSWRGMPKLPDVIDVMLKKREESYQRYLKKESEELDRAWKKLARRKKEHPEEFECPPDVKQKLDALLGKRKISQGQTEAEFQKRKELLQRQREAIENADSE
jgi:hypothetical protein